MEIYWSEADPAHILGSLIGLVVEVDGVDYVVAGLNRECLSVRPWSEADPNDPGDIQGIPWDDVKRLFVY